ncbi:MAG: SCO family protein [Alphaproteobacteria bacterium]|nr:SCO family protein [Alphaproteobacteria bacterium]
MRRPVALVLAVLLAAVPAAAAPPDLSGLGFTQHPGAQVPPDARFRDAGGHAVRFGDLLGGGPIILALGYFHCPNLCGVVQQDLFHALDLSGLKAGADYRLVLVSIDPNETSADAARAKADDLARYPAAGAARAWHFLTGEPTAIQAVADAVGFADRFDPALKQFLHPTGLVFLTGSGRVSGYLLGVGYQAGDVTAGVLRARSGGIARAALPVLLLCFHFDAATGRYTLAIMRIVRAVGALFVLSLGGLLAFIGLSERRRA